MLFLLPPPCYQRKKAHQGRSGGDDNIEQGPSLPVDRQVLEVDEGDEGPDTAYILQQEGEEPDPPENQVLLSSSSPPPNP